jgi:hypothetical protein
VLNHHLGLAQAQRIPRDRDRLIVSRSQEITMREWCAHARAILQKRFNQPVRDFATVGDAFQKPDAVSCIAPDYGVMLPEDWLSDITAIRSQLDAGLLAFWGNRVGDACEAVVIEGTSQFDIIRFMETIGNEADLRNDDIIDTLTDLHRRYTINIFAADWDAVSLEVKNIPGDIRALAQEMYAFCPDCVDQGAGSLDKLVKWYADSIRVFRTLFIMLWWD